MKTKRVKNMDNGMYHIISEPGDGIRYDYFVYIDGVDEFCFMPCDNTFRYPQRLNYWDVKDLSVEIEEVRSGKVDNYVMLRSFANEEQCNIFTLAECVRTIKELHNANSD